MIGGESISNQALVHGEMPSLPPAMRFAKKPSNKAWKIAGSVAAVAAFAAIPLTYEYFATEGSAVEHPKALMMA